MVTYCQRAALSRTPPTDYAERLNQRHSVHMHRVRLRFLKSCNDASLVRWQEQVDAE
jgi:hypothetical protein